MQFGFKDKNYADYYANANKEPIMYSYMNPQGYVDPTSKYYVDRVWEEYHKIKEELARAEHIIDVLTTLVKQLHKDEASQEVDTFSKEPTVEEQIQYHVDALVEMGAKYYSGDKPYMEGYPRLVLPKVK